MQKLRNIKVWLKFYFQNIHPSKIFLTAALIWGIFMAFYVPPFQVPDEPAHFFRAYQISEFHFSPEIKDNRLGGELPISLLKFHTCFFGNDIDKGKKIDFETLKKCLNIPLDENQKLHLVFPNTALYSPVPYIPQSIGIFLGRLIGLPPLILLYLGRLFNLFFWIGFVYQSIKIIPFKKWLFPVLALLPMSIHIAASVSADAFLNGLSFLLISFILKLAFDENNLPTLKNILAVIIGGILIALSKNIYFVIVFLFAIIPLKKFKSKKDFALKLLLVTGVTAFAALISYLLVDSILGKISPIEHLYGTHPPFPQINPDKQIELILSDIKRFIKILLISYHAFYQMAVKSYIGYLGWMEVIFSNKYYLLSVFVILMTAFLPAQNNQFTLSVKQRIIFLAISGLIIFLFSFTMYCSWCEPGAELIENFQGRYFIPVAPLILLSIHSNRLVFIKKFYRPVVLLFILISFMVTFEAIFSRYYA